MPRIYHRSTLRLDQAKRRRFIETFRRQALLEDWIPRPPRGWLAEIRTVSGVSTRDLATRLKIDQSVVVRAEASERKRTLTLAALERYADALDADVHYFLVPRAGLQAHSTPKVADDNSSYGCEPRQSEQWQLAHRHSTYWPFGPTMHVDASVSVRNDAAECIVRPKRDRDGWESEVGGPSGF